MKRLIHIDAETLERSEVCTFELIDDKVTIEPASALTEFPYVAKLAKGSSKLTPSDGVAYYNALSLLRGTYYFVEEVPAED